MWKNNMLVALTSALSMFLAATTMAAAATTAPSAAPASAERDQKLAQFCRDKGPGEEVVVGDTHYRYVTGIDRTNVGKPPSSYPNGECKRVGWHITALCNSAASWKEVERADALAQMKDGKIRYFSCSSDGKPSAEIVRASYFGNAFLRTVPLHTACDALAALPKCLGPAPSDSSHAAN